MCNRFGFLDSSVLLLLEFFVTVDSDSRKDIYLIRLLLSYPCFVCVCGRYGNSHL